MAIKLIDSTKETACRTAEADAIRAKTGGTAPLTFDFANGKGFADAVAAIQSGGSSDIDTPWYKVKVQEVVIGANSVNNPQTAVAYFEGIFGANNVIAVYLKDQKVTYGADELMAFAPNLFSTATNNISTLTAYRIRSNTPITFNTSSGYSCYLYEGSTYEVIYYDNKP